MLHATIVDSIVKNVEFFLFCYVKLNLHFLSYIRWILVILLLEA